MMPTEEKKYHDQIRAWMRKEQQEGQFWSRMLHDHLQQMIVAAKILLMKIQEDTKEEELQEVILILEEAIAESRILSRDLCPPLLFSHGFKPVLEWLSQYLWEQYRLKSVVEFDGNDAAIPEETGYFLIRLIKKAFRNLTRSIPMKQASFSSGYQPNGKFFLTLQIIKMQSRHELPDEAKKTLAEIQEYIQMVDGHCMVEIVDSEILIQLTIPSDFFASFQASQ